jgi:hypothetical protein
MSNPTKPAAEFKFFNDDSSQFNIESDLIKTEDLEIEDVCYILEVLRYR